MHFTLSMKVFHVDSRQNRSFLPPRKLNFVLISLLCYVILKNSSFLFYHILEIGLIEGKLNPKNEVFFTA